MISPSLRRTSEAKSLITSFCGHQPLEFVAPARVDVQLRGDVLNSRLHRLDRVVAVDPRQRRIRGQVPPVFGGLENAFDRIFEEAAILVGRSDGFSLHHRSSSKSISSSCRKIAVHHREVRTSPRWRSASITRRDDDRRGYDDIFQAAMGGHACSRSVDVIRAHHVTAVRLAIRRREFVNWWDRGLR